MNRSGNTLQAVQSAFANAIRDPVNHSPPSGVSPERMRLYHELFYNNVRGSLASAFPVLDEVLPDPLWRSLVRRFWAEHRCHTPEFPRMPREFLLWLNAREAPERGEPPFLHELALWEWAELDVLLDPGTPPDGFDAKGDPLTGVPALNPALRLFVFRYPVHRIAPGFLPDEPESEPVFLAVYRDRDDETQFLELSAPGAALLQAMMDDPGKTGQHHVEALARLMESDPEQLRRFGSEFLDDLLEKGVLLGARANDHGV